MLYREELTDNANEGDDREHEEHHAVTKSLDGRTGDETSNEFTNEGQGRQQGLALRVECILARFGVLGAELVDKALKRRIVSVPATFAVSTVAQAISQIG